MATQRTKVISLYIGRFQPFHKGHLHCLKYISKRSRRLIILVGSAQESHTFDNPLSLSERKELIKRVLLREGLQNIEIYALNDFNDNDMWIKQVINTVPKFDFVYSNNRLVRSLFKKAGYVVKSIPFKSRKDYQGMIIRKKARSLNPVWHSAVPTYLLSLLKKYGFAERVLNAAREDEVRKKTPDSLDGLK